MVTSSAVTDIEVPSRESWPPRMRLPAFQLLMVDAPIDTPVAAAWPSAGVTVRSAELISIVAAVPPLPAAELTLPNAFREWLPSGTRRPASAGNTTLGFSAAAAAALKKSVAVLSLY